VAMVFEDYSLYPHMSTFENIAFPLRVRGIPPNEVKRRVGEVVEMLGLSALLQVPVRSLSGGAQQRVSIGRALVRDPALVMFDEPLSHLDADQKVMLRTEIRRLQTTAGLTSVLVTHDQTEAMAMADRIAVMSQGVLQQVGSPATLYNSPANLFVAGFIGESPMNFFNAQVGDGRLQLKDLPGMSISLDRLGLDPLPAAGSLLRLGIRPEDVQLQAPQDGRALQLLATVLDRECCGDRDVLLVSAGNTRFNLELPSPCRLRAGDELVCHLPLDRLHGFDGHSGDSLNLRRRTC
jgi:ABC-type sugar transport system ATPase subunit